MTSILKLATNTLKRWHFTREAVQVWVPRSRLKSKQRLNIVESPARWRIIEQDVRRCLSHTFPYGILYTIEGDSVLIVAVMHLRRRPGYWLDRLPDSE